MKYDFDRMCDRRNTNCVKWDAVSSIFGREDIIPMWVADMDFPVAQPIVEALKKRVQNMNFMVTHCLEQMLLKQLLTVCSGNLTGKFNRNG